MINQIIVEIIANRILKGGTNPKTNSVYVLKDITNQEYKTAVENYFQENTEGM